MISSLNYRGSSSWMPEPITNVARVAVGAFADSLDKRRDKIISMIKITNTKAVSAIARIPPSYQHMFGGDRNQLAKGV